MLTKNKKKIDSEVEITAKDVFISLMFCLTVMSVFTSVGLVNPVRADLTTDEIPEDALTWVDSKTYWTPLWVIHEIGSQIRWKCRKKYRFIT